MLDICLGCITINLSGYDGCTARCLSKSLIDIATIMAALQKFEIAHLPPNLVAHVALFEEVENAAYLHQQLLQGNPEFEYALIDAACVRSRVMSHCIDYVLKRLDTFSDPRPGRNIQGLE